MFKIFLSVAAATTIASGAVYAADLPSRGRAPVYEVPAFSWAGSYVGLNVGAGIFSGRADPRCLATTALVPNGVGCPIISGSGLSNVGIVGGASIGYNWQLARIIAGLEADVQGSSQDKTVMANGPFPFIQPFTIGPFAIGATPAGATAAAREQMNVFGTVRGRLGYTFDRTLVYVTGGAMIANLSLAATAITPAAFPLPGSTFAPRYNGTQVGGIVGAGVEYTISDRLSGKIEGLYYNLGSQTIFAGERNGAISGRLGARFKTEGEIVRIGLNYKLDVLGSHAAVVAKY